MPDVLLFNAGTSGIRLQMIPLLSYGAAPCRRAFLPLAPYFSQVLVGLVVEGVARLAVLHAVTHRSQETRDSKSHHAGGGIVTLFGHGRKQSDRPAMIRGDFRLSREGPPEPG